MTNLIIFSAKYLYLFEVALLVAYFLVLPKDKKKAIIILSIIFLPLAYIIAKVFSFLYFDPRPFVVGHFMPLVPHIPDNGFPSDHMLLTSAIASIVFVYNKKLGIATWIIAFIIGASRVFSGIHHWVDIAGSTIIIIGTMWLVKSYIIPRLEKNK